MSALADHPNALEARELRRAEIEHAMRCLYRDNTWIDPDGALPVLDYLRRIHYLGRTDRDRDRILHGWLRAANLDPLTPVGELTVHNRERLVWQILRFLKLSIVGSDADPARGSWQITPRPPATNRPLVAGHPSPERSTLTSSPPEAPTDRTRGTQRSTVGADGGES